MNFALYMELLAHSSMGNEEYHFMASASGLVYIMASMLCEGISRDGNLCIARVSYYICIIPSHHSKLASLKKNNTRVNNP